MGELSHYPDTRSDRPFPIGDIPRDSRFRHAMQWIGSFDTFDYPYDRATALYSRIRAEQQNMRTSLAIIQETTGKHAMAKYEMVDRALNLCDWWDTDAATGAFMERVSVGFLAAHSLAIRTNVLPYFYSDYSSNLTEMRYGGQEYARYFGATAWANMTASHQAVLEVHEALNGLLKRTVYQSDADEELHKTGMMLAYDLAAHTAMESQVPPRTEREG